MAKASKSASEDLTGPVLEVLPQLLAEGRLEEVLAAVKALLERNEQLERQLAALGRRQMKANEGVSSAQLMLFVNKLREQQAANAEAEATAENREDLEQRAEAAAERARQRELARAADPKRSPLKKPLPAELPRRDNVIEVPEAERPCPQCGDEREVIGHDVSEVLELIPAQLYVRRDRREKRACGTCEAKIVRAPRGDKIVAGGQIGCSVVAQIVHEKYEQGLPLHRQRKTFQRMGISLSTSTLADQVKWGAELLRPLWLEAIEQSLGSHVMHIDGSGIDVLDRDHPQGKKRGALWGIAGGPGAGSRPAVAAYYYASTKKAKGQRPGELGPSEILAQRTGIVVSDADSLFVEQRRRPDLIDCGCNMHARRYFVKALDAGDSRAALVLGAYKGLYFVEEDYQDATPEERLAARREESTPIYNDIVKWCRSEQSREPPKSPMGRAIAYLLNHELALRRFETDGSIPIDNMAAEHNFVSVALTRKNYLFAGSDAGGERAAIAYTILRCCRLAEVEPVEYLTDVLTVLSRGIRRLDVAELMPASWAAARRS